MDQEKTERQEREILQRVALAAVQEQRRARRWGIFFKLLTAAYVLVVTLAVVIDRLGDTKRHGSHTALVELNGIIGADQKTNADDISAGLQAAFENKHSKAVILRINSPGGSPVQAGYVYEEIRRLRKKYPAKKLYAVITDVCASGGYYIAAAADAIYADQASIVGSIGVLMDGFGFVDGMHKLGVERRLLTSGKHKGMLDPFTPLNPQDERHVQTLLDTIHGQFIARVKAGRGSRLMSDPQIFSGLIWTGEQAKVLGLVDGLGSASYVARGIVGAEDIVDYTVKEDYLERLAERIGVALGRDLAARVVGGSPRLR